MTFAEWFLPELDHEMRTTRSLLERVPFDNPVWKPHAKSTSLGDLASHVVNLAGYGVRVATEPEINFAPAGGAPYAPKVYRDRNELLAAFDANAAKSRAAIAALPEQALGVPWSLKFGDHVIFTQPRGLVLRSFFMNHIIHHRGQLSVYLRLNDVPLPSIYGPTADT
ncbi:MAG TPA: DinB family protein [Gemmatimonadaceae bacterium]|nr:DinB family protein [Gemmatimonadaceae bacterium]